MVFRSPMFEASLVKCYCIGWFPIGGVSELADEHDLGSCAERRGGSSPPFLPFDYLLVSLVGT